ncbi:MAG: hypothetical protein ACKOC5_06320 [Chloroflexota bacterium]
MIPYFTFAAENQVVSGSPAYLESIQRLFIQDQSGGLIEVCVSPDEYWIYLYQEGRLLQAYQVQEDQAQPLLAGRLPPEGAGDIQIRYLALPSQALRAVWQALEWYPPLRAVRIDSLGWPAYLEALRVERVSGLLQVALPGQDGFLGLAEGIPLNSETVLAGARGFVDSLPAQVTRGGACEAWWYEPHSGTLTASLARLRLAGLAWVQASIAGYQRLVGATLVTQLNNAANTWLRQHRYNMRLVGASVFDHHLFSGHTQAALAYHGLLGYLHQHFAQVIGDQLAGRALAEAFRRLKPAEQAELQAAGLGPDTVK